MSVDKLAEEKQLLREAKGKGGLAVFKTYLKCSGPGWLQGAITLGGGSLAGSLYLGVLGGYSLLWLQVLAMIMGVIMLSAITYVTLSTGKRPFKAINDHLNPVLGWSWAMATLMANVVWCLPQFSLGTAAVQQNLLPGLDGNAGKTGICIALLVLAITVIWFYDRGSKGVIVFERILKTMVAVIVVAFFGVVLKMTLSSEGLPWGHILGGLVPNLSLLSQPAPTFDATLEATGAFRNYWSGLIVGQQRDVMITAAATAVGINMTFLLPYSMLRKGWDRESRGLAIFDLGTGLFIPFVLATGCVVIASASQFHAAPQPGVIEGTAKASLVGQYRGMLVARVNADPVLQAQVTAAPESERPALITELAAALPEGDRRMAAMLVKRDAFSLAASLERLLGKGFSQYVFGIGVLGMALSTIIILMLISGFTICEISGRPDDRRLHRIGCMLPALGALGPFVWSGKTQVWLAVPTSVFGMALLPIAYLAFFLMMNNRHIMGTEQPRGGRRVVTNLLMLVALAAAAFGAGWSIWSKTHLYGVGLVALLVLTALIVHFARPPRRA